MRIRELRLAGFKSFVDPVRAPIEAGLTGVVGPNGCGKSNLLEAVRWVMGAASAKALRAGDMDDVIFQGSAGRPQHERAEVTLVLEDPEGRMGALTDGADVVEVSRRIRREMGSTYRVNGKEVRAKDVQLLFADASTGANSPALVRQGQISELIAAKPENRRRILEEAAGISGLHARRHEADLKLRAAETNLEKVDLALKEMEQQANALKRQARQAERYRALAEELRATEAWHFAARWKATENAKIDAHAQLRAAERAYAEAAERAALSMRGAQEADARLAPLKEEELIAAAVLRRLEGVRVGLERDSADAEAELKRLEAEAQRIAADMAAAQTAATDAEAALQRLDAEAGNLGEDDTLGEELRSVEAQAAEAEQARAQAYAHLEAQRAQAALNQAQRAAAAAAHQGAKAACDRARARLDAAKTDAANAAPPADLAARLDAAAEDAERQKARAEKAAKDLEAADKALIAADTAERAAKAKLDEAQNRAREVQAEANALERVLAAQTPSAFPAVLGEIDVTEGFERALAAALGDDLDASLDAASPRRWSGAHVPPQRWAKGIAPLSDHVRAPPALAARLAMIGVVAREVGAALAEDLPPGARLVSKEGDLWRWDGYLARADAPSPAALRMENRNRLKALRAELEKAEKANANSRAVWEKAFAAREAPLAAQKAARLAAPEAAQAANAAAARAARLVADSAEVTARHNAALAQLAAREAELKEAEAALAAAPEPPAGATIDEAPLQQAQMAAEAARAEAQRLASQAASLKGRFDQVQARAAAIAREREDWRLRLGRAKDRAKFLIEGGGKIAAAREAAKAKPKETAAALAAVAEEFAAAEKRRAAAADALAQAEARARETESQSRTGAASLRHAEQDRVTAQSNAQAGEQAFEQLREEAQNAGFGSLAAMVEKAGAIAEGPLKSADVLTIEKRLERLRGEREGAGPVNLQAEEELTQALERITGLTAEKDDVSQAIAKLRHAIGRLNGEARARLLKAFEAINGHFTTLFATLFEGGQAELKLTESEDPLASGLEIYACPPGKRLSTLSLMSGGEQALTASALIFAVFLANPAPLCVLDEVDAPLDDANVDRFCRMLNEMRRQTDTRFMVITHNPVTMARMDRLYGVTMGEPGVSQLVSVDLKQAAAMAER